MNFIPIKRIAKKLLLKLRLVGAYFYIRQIVRDIQTSGKINHLKQTGELLPPYSFVLETNFACNLRCYFCYQREIHTINQKWLTPDEIRNFFSNILPEHIHDITLLGGEIFVRNDIFEIFSIFEEMKINFSIITNGTVLNQKKIKKLFDYKYLKKLFFLFMAWKKLMIRL